jgi:monoamine oxidase
MAQSISRRALVRGFAAGTAATAVSSRVLAQQATPAPASAGSGDFDVIVVGSGLAGMGAGRELKLRGVSAVVLEARDRIGGRCYCDNSFPAPYDYGGQFFQQVVPNIFGGTNNPLYDMYIAQGGPDVPCVLVPSFAENGMLLPESDQAPFHDMATAVGAELAVAGIAAQLGGPDMSVADATADLAAEPWYTLTTAFMGLAFNVPVSQLSVLDAWNDLEYAINPSGAPSDKVNPTGMGNFAAQFADGLDIRLSTRVTEIDMTGADTMTVVTDQGPLTAKTVIVTVPVSLLAAGEVKFTPELPTEYSQAFADLPFGVVDKVGVAFSSDIFGEVPANTIITSHQDQDTAHFGMGLAKLAGKPMMNVFAANDLARSLEADGDLAFEAFVKEFVTATLGADAATAIDRTHITAWGKDPFTLGSYSAAKVGKEGARATLAEPIDNRLYFAGEAISTTSHSSLHGAYLTGKSAATAIVDALNAAQ